MLHDAEHRGEQDHADGDERERELLAAGADLARLERRERSSDELPLEDQRGESPRDHQACRGPHHPAEHERVRLVGDDLLASEDRRCDHPGDDHPEAHRERHTKADQDPRAEGEQAHFRPHAQGRAVRAERNLRRDEGKELPRLAAQRRLPVEVAEEGGQRGSEQSPPESAHPGAGLRPIQIEDEHRLAGRGAVGEGEIFIVDVVAPQRNREQHAEQTRHRQPAEDLQRREVHGKAELGPRVEHVHRRQHDAHEARLAGRRARRLHQVVLPARTADAGEERDGAQRQVPEEGAHYGNVGAVADLQHHVRIRPADDRRDDHRRRHRAKRQLAASRRRSGANACPT